MNWTAKKRWQLTGVLAVLLLLPNCQAEDAPATEHTTAASSRPPPRDEPIPSRPAVCSQGGWCWMQPSAPSDSFQDSWAVDDETVLAVGLAEHVLHWRGGSWEYLPSGTSNVLYSVWASSLTNAWAVGENGTIVHWDGAQWTRVRTGGSTLFAVFGTGPQDVWAGGQGGLLLHWNGTQWQDVPSRTTRAIRALWASGPQDLWVSAFNSDSQGAVRRWNGQTWSTLLDEWELSVRSIWGFGPGDVWISGAKGLLAHWSGNKWQQAKRTGSNTFLKVRGNSSSDLWLSGSALWHYDGNTLTLQSYDYSAVFALYSVAVGSTGPVLAVGVSGTFVRHVEGDQWEVQVAPAGPGLRSFQDVWARASTDIWAARDDARLWRWNGFSWNRMTGTPLMSMRNISGSSQGDVWVTGRMNYGGEATIAHFDGTHWSEAYFSKTESFEDIWALHTKAVWTVGQSGSVLRWDGQTWATTRLTQRKLWAVHGSGESNVWTAGEQGALFQWNGQQWVDRSITGPELRAIWVFGPSDVWVAADDQSLWHWDGQQLREVPSAASVRVNAFFGRAPNDLWAVGDAGGILHWDGQTWTSCSSGTRMDLLGLSGADGSLFAVGWGETFLQRD